MNEENKVEESIPETITESEAQLAQDTAVTRDEAIAQGVDVEKAENEATPVEVVPDELPVTE